MKIKTRILIGVTVITLLISSVGVISVWQINRVSNIFETRIPGSIVDVNKTAYLDGVAQFIRYYDEVLTQSARNYAFTGDVKWRDRYNSIVPELDAFIKEAIDKGDLRDKDIFSSVDVANGELVRMEEEAMGLVDDGRAEEAVAILESDNYWHQKSIYEQGLRDYVTNKGVEYERVLEASTGIVEVAVQDSRQLINGMMRGIIISTVAVLVLALIVVYLIAGSILRSISKLSEASRAISRGDLDYSVVITSQDEFGELSRVFDDMTRKVKKSRVEVDRKVKEQTVEIRRRQEEAEQALRQVQKSQSDAKKINKYMVGRELKMKELKKELQQKRDVNRKKG